MSELTHQPCPDQDNCGSSDAYSFNIDKGVGKCFSCDLHTYVYNGKLYGKSGANGKARLLGECEEMTNPFDNIPSVPNTKGIYKEHRGIKRSVFDFYNVKTYSDMPWYDKKTGEKGTSEEIRFIYPNGSEKLRRMSLDKEHRAHFAISGGAINELFGMNLFPAGCSKQVTIVEGEFDALAAYQMLEGGGYKNPVVSLPNATPNAKLYQNCKTWLESFQKIILSLDSDGKANGVAEVLFDLFPDKVYVMNHGKYKDANDFLMNNDIQAYKNAWWSARKFSPAGFTASKEDWANALDNEDPYEYVPTPIEGFNKVARGLVKGGITVVKAPPGTGKSSLLRMLQYDLVVRKGNVVAPLMMEEMKSTTGRAMATYHLGTNVMTREDAENNGITEDKVKEALFEVIGDERFVSFDINPQDPIQDCLRQCKWAVSVFNANFIFIDHLQRLAYLSGTESATSALTELGVKLTEFAKRKNVGIICISHVNSDGKTKYASSIEEEAIVLVEMERDKMSEDPVEKNTTYLTVTKNRPFALTGPAGALLYDPETTLVTERKFGSTPMYPQNKDPFDV